MALSAGKVLLNLFESDSQEEEGSEDETVSSCVSEKELEDDSGAESEVNDETFTGAFTVVSNANNNTHTTTTSKTIQTTTAFNLNYEIVY